MKYNALQSGAMSGSLGDIFWDVAPLVAYSPGFDLGCNIYVANPTDAEKEYALMARLTRQSTIVSEEAIPVFGYTWFKVDPDDFVTLKGALRFNDSDADLTLSLMERETGEAIDTVATRLLAPATSSLPPAWPGAPGTGGTGTDWSSMMSMMVPVIGFVMLGMVMASSLKPRQEAEKLPSGRTS